MEHTVAMTAFHIPISSNFAGVRVRNIETIPKSI